MKIKLLVTAAFLTGTLSAGALSATSPYGRDYRDAVRLYENGMYDRARAVFENMSSDVEDPMISGYALLCSIKQQAAGYEETLAKYFEKYGNTPLSSEIRQQYASNLFDAGRYADAAAQLDRVDRRSLSRQEVTETIFKRAYCDYALDIYDGARAGFEAVTKRPKSEFTAPSQYALGYMDYSDNRFADAFPHFEEASGEPQFEQQSLYYMLECKFMEKDYAYVAKHGDDIYQGVPDERKPRLARILSESYLVQGNAGKAKKYFDVAMEQKQELNSTDAFYAGSLQYNLGEFQSAIDNFLKMGERRDSIGQIASYQMGYSYIQTKNKVAAMSAFKDAGSLDYDPAIKEDALFNHAKLAFDLNRDPSPFKDYLATYKDSGRGDQIYDYIAVASLYNGDYAGAVEAYDNIENLTPAMKSNYMKANFLRAGQYIGSSSYRNAIPCLKAATFFAPRQDNFNKLARYWLGESYYKTGDYPEAEKVFTDLYNQSALDNKAEGKVLPYNLAYCFFDAGDYASAAGWFDKYVASGDGTFRLDALTRRADCDFIRKDYKSAIESYAKASSEFSDPDNIYPYYQQGICYGLLNDKAGKISALSRVSSASSGAPFYAEALYELGRTYVSDGNEPSAVKTFRTIVSRASDSTYIAKSLIELGMIERNKSEYDKALSYYKQVAENFDGTESSEAALLAIESIYQSRGEPEKYIEYTESLGGASKTDAEKELVYFNSAEQIFLTANYEKAVVALDKYLTAYPEGRKVPRAMYYKAECYKAMGDKEKACDCYVSVMSSPDAGADRELAVFNFANLSYGMEHYTEAYSAYSTLLEEASLPENRTNARLGKMRSAYRGRDYQNAIAAAGDVRLDGAVNSDGLREADYVTAKSLLATSRRDKAFEILRVLARHPATDEGAEAAYLVIQDTYDQGKFTEVESAVYRFADAAPSQGYWLAKAFIVLGDSFAESENYRQAKATFESIRDGYAPASGLTDDVTENVRVRLEKLNELMNR